MTATLRDSVGAALHDIDEGSSVELWGNEKSCNSRNDILHIVVVTILNLLFDLKLIIFDPLKII